MYDEEDVLMEEKRAYTTTQLHPSEPLVSELAGAGQSDSLVMAPHADTPVDVRLSAEGSGGKVGLAGDAPTGEPLTLTGGSPNRLTAAASDVRPLAPTGMEGRAGARNACKLCAPLGAAIAMRGLEDCVPLIHGSQGCATYIRRYVISHFREPIDIASSNFTEETAVFGGMRNLFTALDNVIRGYKPAVIGVAGSCLSETIGDDVRSYLRQYARTDAPVLFYASTPSYKGSHVDGFSETVYAAVAAIAEGGPKEARVNLVSAFVSTEDLRALHAILSSFGLPYCLVPDYSETLDGGSWTEYQKLPKGGTPLESIRLMGRALGTVTLGQHKRSAGRYLEEMFGVPDTAVPLPIGVGNCDRFFAALSRVSGRPVPAVWGEERARLIDAYADGHKYVNGKRAVVYGEEDFASAVADFLREVGIEPVVAATGGKASAGCGVSGDADFVSILEEARGKRPDLVIGNSKGLYLSRALGVPLVRAGFPVHDRMGAQRILHLGYKGTTALFDTVCNALLARTQDAHNEGYTYL
jgi:nitrogenase molybdenum-iron protein NifN